MPMLSFWKYSLVDVVDVNKHNFDAFLTYLRDHSQSIFLEKLDIRHICVMCVSENVTYVYPRLTCETRPGWRCRRRRWARAWLRAGLYLAYAYQTPFSIHFSSEIGYETCTICVFENIQNFLDVLLTSITSMSMMTWRAFVVICRTDKCFQQ